MAERLKTNTQQNWEERNYCSFGPNFRIDTGNPQMGIDGENVYAIYGVTNSKEQSSISLTQGGHFRILNDRTIEITAGNKAEEEGVDIALNSLNGSITLTALANGSVQIKGKNIVLDASEDVDIKAGRNITLTGGSTIKIDAMKVEVDGLLGNVIETVIGSFGTQVFSLTSFAGEVAGLAANPIGIGGAIGAATDVAGALGGFI
jgi:hypothetical protein